MRPRRVVAPPAAPERPVVRVICPSAGLTAPQLEEAEAQIERLAGACDVRFDRRTTGRAWRDYYAGDDAARLERLVAACEEPGVDIVWWARGGGGAGRIAGAAIEALRRVRPRILIGFSDATSVLNALNAALGWITFHGPVITSLARADLPSMLALLRGEARTVEFAPATGPALRGILRGGNLMTLASLAGRAFMPDGAGALWMFEEVDEAARRVDRCLEQLRDAGAFEGAHGLWLGALYPEGIDPDRARIDVGLPVATGAPADHHGPMALLPLGVEVRLRPSAGRLELLEPVVETAYG